MNANAKFKLIVWGVALSLLIAAVAFLVAISQSRAVNRQLALRTLAAAHVAQVHVVAERLKTLEQLSATIAVNPGLLGGVAHIPAADAAAASDPPADVALDPPVGVTPVREQLEQLRRAAGLKAAAILGPDGKTIAASGDISFSRIDFSSLAAVTEARSNSAPASGLLEGERRVHFVAVNPLKNGTTIAALLLTADQFDDASVRTTAQIGQTDLALIANSATGSRVLSSTLDTGDARELPAITASHQAEWRTRATTASADAFEIEIGGRPWTALVTKLLPSSANSMLLSLVPPPSQDDVFAALASPLMAGVLAGVLVLLAILYLLWSRIIGPMATMVDLSARARHGDYALALKTGSSGLAGRLALAFNYLLNELDRHRAPPGAPRRRATDRK